MQKKKIIENFLEHTSIHGVYYTKASTKIVKYFWLLIVLTAALLIVLSTFLMIDKYLTYDYYKITEEREMDKLDEIPRLLVCSSNKISITDSIVELMPELDSTSDLYFNETLMDELKYRFIKVKRISLSKCQIHVKSNEIDCMKFKQDIIFTLSGFCLLLDFDKFKENKSNLMKEFQLFENLNEYKIKIYVRFNYFGNLQGDNDGVFNKNKTIYFQTLSPSDYKEKMLFSQLNNKLITFIKESNRYFKNYDIIPNHVQYNKALVNKKCFKNNRYDEFSCHYECLKRLIDKTLKCQFMSNCKVKDLAQVEEIIRNYTSLRNDLNICDKCLPNCESYGYNVIETASTEITTRTPGFIWNLFLNFKRTEVKYVLNFDSAALLNFINGLWSLLLGLSILSFWEIFELFYALANQCYWFERIKFLRNFFRLEHGGNIKKTKNAFLSVFKETYLHGFKNLLIDEYSNSVKFRWIIVIIMTSIGFFFAIRNAVYEYQQFNSDFKQTLELITSKPEYNERELTIFVCKSVQLVNSNDIISLNEFEIIANQMFLSNNSSLAEIIDKYKNILAKNNLLTEEKSNYSKIYSKSRLSVNLKFSFDDVYERKIRGNAEMYFDKQCVLFETNVPLKKSIGLESSYQFLVVLGSELEPIYKLEVFLLDSESLHISKKSKFDILDGGSPSVVANLKYNKLLPSPFKPSCNKDKDYNQQKCYQNCFNDILKRTFGCKVVYGELNPTEERDYCNPFMLPLIRSYERHVLKGSNEHFCERCIKPCEYYHYELDVVYGSKGKLSNFGINQFIMREEQIAITTFEEVLYISISYLSLFYGGSILAIIQIFFNIGSCMKKPKKIQTAEMLVLTKPAQNTGLVFLKKLEVVDLLSKSTTIHCAKYLSSLKKNDFKKLFWLITITSTIAFSIFMLVIEIQKYNKSIQMTRTLDSNIEVMQLPKLDVCTTIDYPYRFIDFNNSFQFYSDFFLHMYQLRTNINETFVNTKFTVKSCYEKYDQVFSLLNYTKHFNYTWTTVVNNYLGTNSGYFILKTSNQVWFYSETTKMYQTSVLFDDVISNRNGFAIDLCRTVNVSILNKQITFNPFINLEENILDLQFKVNEHSKDYKIYLNNHLMPPVSFELKEKGDYKRIKSIYNDFDYRYSCKNKDNCIFNQKLLKEYSDHELFLCNDELKETIYDLFNCTPFINTTKRVPECTILQTLTISDIMSKFKPMLFKCEISTASFPIEHENYLIPFQKNNSSMFVEIDFNGVKANQLKIVEEYDLLQLIVNLSNFLNVLIGFSFITIFELIFIFIYNKCCIATVKVTSD